MINGTEMIPAEEDGDMLGFNFMQYQEVTSLPDTSVLIDTGSTVSVFKNKEVLRNITKSASALRAHTNGGFQDSTLQGYLPGFFKVWYNRGTSYTGAPWKWRTYNIQGTQKRFIFGRHKGDPTET